MDNIYVWATETDEKPKGSRRTDPEIGSKLPPETFIEKVKNVSELISQGLNDLSNNTGNGYYLDEIEMKVEMTAKGELRLLASAGIETAGAVTLKFKRREKK